MTRRTRVGIIGCGGMARSHASRMSEVLHRVEISAVVDLDLGTGTGGGRTLSQ